MNILYPVRIFLAFFMLTTISASYAADTLKQLYPKVVLVQLRSEQNRIAAMVKDREYKGVEQVKKDAEEVKNRMILDFTNNYHSTPVYYYMDSNADLVKNKHFNGILMNADGTTVNNPIINSNSDDYIIVYFGYIVFQPDPAITDTNRYINDPATRPGKGLVVLDDQYMQIDYFYKLGYDEFFFKLKKRYKKYYYVSKRYDIEYFPFAQLFEEHLGDRYARHRIQPRSSKMK